MTDFLGRLWQRATQDAAIRPRPRFRFEERPETGAAPAEMTQGGPIADPLDAPPDIAASPVAESLSTLPRLLGQARPPAARVAPTTIGQPDIPAAAESAAASASPRAAMPPSEAVASPAMPRTDRVVSPETAPEAPPDPARPAIAARPSPVPPRRPAADTDSSAASAGPESQPVGRQRAAPVDQERPSGAAVGRPGDVVPQVRDVSSDSSLRPQLVAQRADHPAARFDRPGEAAPATPAQPGRPLPTDRPAAGEPVLPTGVPALMPETVRAAAQRGQFRTDAAPPPSPGAAMAGPQAREPARAAAPAPTPLTLSIGRIEVRVRQPEARPPRPQPPALADQLRRRPADR